MGAAQEKDKGKVLKPGEYDPDADLASIDLGRIASDEAKRAKELRGEVAQGTEEAQAELDKASDNLDRLDRLLRKPPKFEAE